MTSQLIDLTAGSRNASCDGIWYAYRDGTLLLDLLQVLRVSVWVGLGLELTCDSRSYNVVKTILTHFMLMRASLQLPSALFIASTRGVP